MIATCGRGGEPRSLVADNAPLALRGSPARPNPKSMSTYRQTSLISASTLPSGFRKSASQRSCDSSSATRCGGATNSTPRQFHDAVRPRDVVHPEVEDRPGRLGVRFQPLRHAQHQPHSAAIEERHASRDVEQEREAQRIPVDWLEGPRLPAVIGHRWKRTSERHRVSGRRRDSFCGRQHRVVDLGLTVSRAWAAVGG